jgi:hypothetical protein
MITLKSSHSDLLSLTSPKVQYIQMMHWSNAHGASWGEVGVTVKTHAESGLLCSVATAIKRRELLARRLLI